MTNQQFLTILALTESNNNPNAPLGDHGRALGRFQVHPDWVWTWSTKSGIYPKLNETWDSYIMRLVEWFYKEHIDQINEYLIAMYFHIGHLVYSSSPEWDKEYADRFEKYKTQVLNSGT